MHQPRVARGLAARVTVAAAIASAALVGTIGSAPAATNAACKLLTPKVIKSTLGLTVPKGKPAQLIDEEEETSACVWATGTPTAQQIARGTPGVYVALVKSGDTLAAEPTDDSDEAEDDDGQPSVVVVKVPLKVTGGQSGFASAVPGWSAMTMGVVFNDSSGAAIFIGSMEPGITQLDAFASAVAKQHG